MFKKSTCASQSRLQPPTRLPASATSPLNFLKSLRRLTVTRGQAGPRLHHADPKDTTWWSAPIRKQNDKSHRQSEANQTFGGLEKSRQHLWRARGQTSASHWHARRTVKYVGRHLGMIKTVKHHINRDRQNFEKRRHRSCAIWMDIPCRIRPKEERKPPVLCRLPPV